MKELKVNEWMEQEMFGYLFFVVYAESEEEWWIFDKCDSYEEAESQLTEEIESSEEGSGEWLIIDCEGKKVER